jgi:PleD family two-component response regulator
MEKKYKILIVDDDENVRDLYAEIFRTEGFEVIEAVDGLEGVDKAIANTPDIIFTGIIMPKMDGFGLKEALSKNVATSNIPVVMSSHMGREEDHQKAMEVGIRDFFIVGMITPKEVVARIKSFFSQEQYQLKAKMIAGDFYRLAQDLKLKSDLTCEKCNTELVLELKITNTENREFSGKIICPKCGAK